MNLPNYNTPGRPRIHVIGDAMWDVWITAAPKGFAQESAAVPRWAALGQQQMPGGAANVVASCIALGGYVTEDLTPPAFRCQKLRVVDTSDGFALVTRLDLDMAPPGTAKPALAPCPLDALVIADYSKGFCRDFSAVYISEYVDHVVLDARQPEKYLELVDSRWVATPNSREFLEARGVYAEFTQRGGRVVITMGRTGAMIAQPDNTGYKPVMMRVPEELRRPSVSTCGAGDAFNAALAVALGGGAALEDAVAFAVRLASAAVHRPFTCVASLEDLP